MLADVNLILAKLKVTLYSVVQPLLFVPLWLSRNVFKILQVPVHIPGMKNNRYKMIKLMAEIPWGMFIVKYIFCVANWKKLYGVSEYAILYIHITF